jgi:hypothetical protein
MNVEHFTAVSGGDPDTVRGHPPPSRGGPNEATGGVYLRVESGTDKVLDRNVYS